MRREGTGERKEERDIEVDFGFEREFLSLRLGLRKGERRFLSLSLSLSLCVWQNTHT
jgi:hypothetical protein